MILSLIHVETFTFGICLGKNFSIFGIDMTSSVFAGNRKNIFKFLVDVQR